ncbi:MAG: hypothetical protein E7588_00295 [Ruminococcaceae bacterium]|nr:hypothetical protein [Oscillospiraceae bacterium]
MKKRVLTAVLSLLLLFLFSCERPIQDPVPVKPDDNVESQDNKTDNDPTNPYNAEDIKAFIQEKYAIAKEAYFWFEVNSLPPAEHGVDINSIKEIDGLYYYKVGHDTIKSLSDLESYLKSIFSDEITARLMEEGKEKYIDVEGELWAVDAQRGTDISVGNVIFTLQKKGDNKVVYSAHVEELDLETLETVGMKVYDYVYEKTPAGWRWTEFDIYE